MARQFSEAFVQAHQALYGRDRPVESPPSQPPLTGSRVLSFVLPMPPSVNSLYGVGANGQKYLVVEQTVFRSDVHGIVNLHMRGDPPMLARLDVWMRLHFNTKRRCDIDNRIKAALDALTHAHAYGDDSQIDKLTVERVVDPDGQEYCNVEIREMA